MSVTLLAAAVEARAPRAGTQPTIDPAPGSLSLETDGETLTVTAREVSVGEVLEEIARRSGLLVDLEGPLDERVSLDFARLPLREALDRILRGRNFALRLVGPVPRAASSTGSIPSRLWVYSREVGGDRAGSDSGGGHERRHLTLTGDDEKARLGAVIELADLGGEQAVEALATAALSDPASSVREEAAYALGELGDPSGLQVLKQALADPDRGVREAAVEAVADIGGDEAAWALAAALADQDPSLREQAVYALGDIGGDAAVTILQRATVDERGFIREAAAEVLEELGRKR